VTGSILRCTGSLAFEAFGKELYFAARHLQVDGAAG
jgi:hypothetical protein